MQTKKILDELKNYKNRTFGTADGLAYGIIISLIIIGMILVI